MTGDTTTHPPEPGTRNRWLLVAVSLAAVLLIAIFVFDTRSPGTSDEQFVWRPSANGWEVEKFIGTDMDVVIPRTRKYDVPRV